MDISNRRNWQQLEDCIEDLTEDMRSILEDVYQLSIHVACNDFLRRCLRVKDYNVDKAVKLVKNVVRSTQSLQDMVHKFRPKFYEELYFSGIITLLRSRDCMGRQVFVSRIGKCDMKEYDFDEFAAAQILVFSLAVAWSPETQRNGVVFVYDLTGFGIKHLTAMKPGRLLQLVGMMQNASPGRIKAVHLVFHPRVFGLVYNKMVRPIFTEKLVQRVYFHGDNLCSLHKFVGTDILPVSLGGCRTDSEAFDTTFLKKLIREDNIHTEMRTYGIPTC